MNALILRLEIGGLKVTLRTLNQKAVASIPVTGYLREIFWFPSSVMVNAEVVTQQIGHVRNLALSLVS